MRSSNVSGFSEGIGMALANYHDEPHVRQLHVEWAIDHWAAIELGRYAYVFDNIFKHMTDDVTYNDLDCTAQIVDWEGAQAIAHQDQNRNYVYARKPSPEGSDGSEMSRILRHMDFASGEFRIYRYWLVPRDDEEREGHSQEWADYPPGKYGPSRPTLEWLIENKGTKYNDLRDGAWIASLDPLGTAHGIIGRYHDFKAALFNLDTLQFDVAGVSW